MTRNPGTFKYHESFGFKSVATPSDRIDLNSVFWIASCTKLFTTVAALQCVERGLITLDEDVARVLPEWKDPDILVGFKEADGVTKPVFKKAKEKLTLRWVCC
jgi:CubicO group peptidase (beta-lactamase class C family)